MKNDFYFECLKCKHIFKGKQGDKCPNCNSLETMVLTLKKLMKFFKG